MDENVPKSDLEGLQRAGVAARIAGQSYFDNPIFFSSVPTDTVEQLLEWHDLCCAWAAGWLKEKTPVAIRRCSVCFTSARYSWGDRSSYGSFGFKRPHCG